ncbi:MAG: P1 family peptidase [Acidobacteria bacterium]|nr:P1 family peptidase [Acidobacteriota bacterium]
MRGQSRKNRPGTLPGIRVGHASDFRGLTGCTVILCEGGAVCGADIRGSAAGTREIAPCLPGHLVDCVHAVFLTGGSAYGLDAAAGIMQYLESRGVGFVAGRSRIPIVPGAVIFDLNLGSARARPTSQMARAACRRAGSTVEEGSVGAGTGATVGKLFGISQATKGGVGYQRMALRSGVEVHALTVVNAFGDVVDPATGMVMAGARASRRSTQFVRTADRMFEGEFRKSFATTNTTLAVVMTNAALNKLEATKVAQMAQDGLARAICPAHTQFDGDLVFALSVGGKAADLNTLGTAAAETTARAIVSALRSAQSLGGVPSLHELESSMA